MRDIYVNGFRVESTDQSWTRQKAMLGIGERSLELGMQVANEEGVGGVGLRPVRIWVSRRPPTEALQQRGDAGQPLAC